ncbi:uncharacterized protein A4U43_C08F22030 [Asparagus officinalis]|nr:uncharacterized protein A4U43_C08F22030 [Asparagus officinalis]
MATEDEATSKLKVWRSAAYRKGTDTQLLNIKSGAHPTNLFILSGDRFEASKAFRAGDLSVRIIRLSGNPVSMVTCMVGDHQWMLAKDSMVLRVGPRSFVFALPGLLYGLALPAGGQMEQRLEMLEEIFGSFCAYQDLVAKDGSKLDDPKPEPDNWANAYTKILTLAAEASAKISTTSLTPKSSSTSSSSDSSSDSTLKKIQRAVRMSAAIKLLSRALLSGSLIPGNHLHLCRPLTPRRRSSAYLPDNVGHSRHSGCH